MLALARQLKLAIHRISVQSQSIGLPSSDNLQSIRLQADMALRFIDGFMMSTDAASGQQQMNMEPVSVQSLLLDVVLFLY